MFHQPLTPIHDSLLLSVLVAALPVATVLVLLGIARRPAWQASTAGLLVCFPVAVFLWHMPLGLALDSAAAGACFGLWPIMWIVFNALVLYNIAVRSGRFDAFRRWILENIPNDRRIILVVIGFCFGALLEGTSGFGTPVAITSALLIALGFPALEAVVYTLIFDTAPVAFGALGVPVTTLAAVTGLPANTLAAMIGRQLPFIALLLPFYVIGLYGGMRSLRSLWPVLTVAGVSFALAQFATSNYLSYELTDVVSSLVSLLCTVYFLKAWKPRADPGFAIVASGEAALKPLASSPVATWQGWAPWAWLSFVVIVWTTLKFNLLGEMKIPWPGLDQAVFITLYDKPYAAVWTFQPLATGTAILFASIVTAMTVRLGVGGYFAAVRDTWIQIRFAILTVGLIVALAYLMNYSGLAYTLGKGAASAGIFFPMLSAFLGWLAVFLSGSDTSGNALFGNLQVVAANQLGLNPVLIAATNSSGGVMGKMISPQNISTGCATSDMQSREGLVLARTFKHSLVLTVLLGIIVFLQQYLFRWMIPQ